MIVPNQELEPKRELASRSAQSANWIWIVLVSIVWGVSFHAIERDFHYSEIILDEDYEGTDDLVAAGNVQRRAGFFALGGLGVLMLLVPGRRQWCPREPTLMLMAIYVILSIASIVWSADAGYSIRRVPILGLSFLAVLGAAKHLSIGDLTRLALLVTSVQLAVGIGAELALNTWLPSDPTYRFAGTAHPNIQGISCALMAMAALSLGGQQRRRWILFLGLACAGVLFMLLTKSRNAAASFVVAVALAGFVRLPTFWRTIVATFVPSILITAAIVTVSASDNPQQLTKQVLLLGRTEDAVTLSGRLPLWAELFTYIGQRPLLGFGYGAFWNAERVRAVGQSQGWSIVHAHSGYIETALNLGLVGVACLGLLTVVGGWRVWGYGKRNDDPFSLFVLSQIAFGIVASVGENYHSIPTLSTVILSAQLAAVSFRDPAQAC